MKRGIFITLEGPEGAGKSTQGKKLAAWLKRRGRKVLFTREPGGTATGQKLRNVLLDPRSRDIDPFVELCLYEAGRAILVRQVIAPALKAGKVVIVDRFQDSTWVYQGYAGGMDRRIVEAIGHLAMGKTQPDLTILLDLPVKVGLRRVTRPNRFEAKPLAFHEKVRAGYRYLARRERRFRLIRADQPAGKVQQQIQKAVADVLEKYRRA